MVKEILQGFRLLQRRSLCRVFRLYFAYGLVSKDVIELIGIVEETFPNATFRVKVLSPQAKDHELHCTLAGRMRVHRVRILPGDRVKVEMTPYDLEKGRIIYRFRSDQNLSTGEEGQEAGTEAQGGQ